MSDLMERLERIAPTALAEHWDNVGLLLGSPDREVDGPVLLTIDFTEPVCEEALEAGCSAVIAYHPPVFHAFKRMTSLAPEQRAVLRAVQAGMAVYSPHTALDAAQGGVTDWLCDMLSPEDGQGDMDAVGHFADRRALRAHAAVDRREACKVVTFVPREHVETVRNALASIGAGRIGEYEVCSFGMEGEGTFLGGAGTKPAVGEAGRLETAREIRLEMVCPADALGLACEVIHRFHPYEEPAWDVYALSAKPDRKIGAGRKLTLDRPAPVRDLAERLKKRLGIDAVKVAAVSDSPVERVGVCPGAGASLLNEAIADGCEVFVTGEMTHHEAMSARARGCSVILAGHTNTERGFLPIYASRIRKEAAGVQVIVSQRDRSPFRTY
ncbi:MAG: Nif3-like dinuclear metal center hexameric protein [Planctomycetota bacterium]|nr:Nif3-like dinuclear metal center hexameric protein [Planctomycetota bacterium]